METQDPLFHEDWRDAMNHLVKALGGFEAVGMELFPAKTRAASWLYDCLSQDRPAKLDLEEVSALLAMGRQRGIHVGMHELCDEIGYEIPKPAAPKSKRTELAEQYARHAAEVARLAREMDRLEAAAHLRAVKEGA